MFANIRRHQKWLWYVISFFVIISFVWYFNPDAQRGSGSSIGGNPTVGSINGKPITRNQYYDANEETQLRYLFRFGQWPKDDENARHFWNAEREARNRLLLTEKIKEYNIKVSDTAVAQWISEAFKDPKQGGFRPDAYDRFVKEQLPQQGLNGPDFERFVRHEIGIEHLVALAGAPGKLAPPQEAEQLYRKENEKVEAQVVFFSSSNYLAQIKPEPAAIATYFTNQAGMYRIQERVQLSYVAFPSSNYLDQADQQIKADTNFQAKVDAMYEKQGPNYHTDTNGAPLSAEAAKERIKVDARKNYALREARKQAIEFASKLLEMEPKTVANLNTLAATNKLQVEVTEPFTQFESPKGWEVPENFGRTAFSLTPDEPFAEQPIVGEDAVYVIAYNKRLPSEMPPFETVREKVTTNYIASQAMTMARFAGNAFNAALTNGLAQKKDFQAICQEQNIVPLRLSPFSQGTPTIPELAGRPEASSIKDAALALTPGQASPFKTSRDGGFIVYVSARLPVTDIPKEELRTFTENLRKRRQQDAFEEWFVKQSELAQIKLPGDKTEQQQ